MATISRGGAKLRIVPQWPCYAHPRGAALCTALQRHSTAGQCYGRDMQGDEKE
nr:MAG TPA: hypothetical protein [Caudoviricetes sp.]